MDDERFHQANDSACRPGESSIQSAFERALGLPPEARAALLAETFGDRPDQRRRVEALLRAHASAGILDASPWTGAASDSNEGDSDALPFRAGDSLGPYRLLRELGRGGFAVVFLAEQETPVRRRVAVKVLLPGVVTTAVMNRFEFERVALERMEHPNVARLLDAGRATVLSREEGRVGAALSFLVMELVEGVSICDHCREHGLTATERIELIALVCDGVQHAHQRGIIHRDLKPTNVLVTTVGGKPVPRIIDFGVAKLLEEADLAEASRTRDGQLLGTPEYMSPEQASGARGAVDTRTDVYALGTLLYETLTGRTPHDTHHCTPLETLRRIREEPPARLPHGRGVWPHDLTFIVAQALRRSPEERYATAAELGADLRRALRHEPISARRPNAAYVLSRFVRRHRAAVVLGSLALLTLTAGLMTMSALWARANAARVSQARILTFLELCLKSAQPPTHDRATRGVTILARAAKLLETTEPLDPQLRIAGWRVIAKASLIEGRRREAAEHLRRVYALTEETQGPHHPDTIAALANFVHTAGEAGAYEIAMGVPDADGTLLKDAHTFAELWVARATQTDFAGTNGLVFALDSLATILASRERFDEAFTTLDEATLLLGDPIEQDGVQAPFIDFHRAHMLNAAGRWAEAKTMLERHLPPLRERLGDAHVAVRSALGNYAFALRMLGDREGAIDVYRSVVATRLALAEPLHEDDLNTVNSLGFLELEQGHLKEAEETLRLAVNLRRNTLGPDHPDTLVSINNLTRLFVDQGRFGDALGLTVGLAHAAADLPPSQRKFKGIYFRRHAAALAGAGRLEEALAWLVKALDEVSRPQVVDEALRARIQQQIEEVRALLSPAQPR